MILTLVIGSIILFSELWYGIDYFYTTNIHEVSFFSILFCILIFVGSACLWLWLIYLLSL